jgi:hypothetical protein
MRVNTFVSTMMIAAGLVAASSMALAQNATPNPQDLEPRVNTSATPPARETPRPEDLEPRVNTSEAAPAATPQQTPATNAGASTPGAAGTSPNAAQTNAATRSGARGRALDRLELDTTQITGNRELPKVLYIVPWKRSDLGDLVGKPVNSLLDEVLTPVDRDVFQRENRYYRALTPGAVENDALSAPDGRAPTPVREPIRTNTAPAAGSKGSATHPTNTPGSGVSTGSGSATSPPRDEK